MSDKEVLNFAKYIFPFLGVLPSIFGLHTLVVTPS